MVISALLYTFLISLLAQLYFFIFVISRLAFIKKSNPSIASGAVSVIICARNEAQNLGRLIDSLSRQNYPDFEVIIINDRSTDQTEELLKEAEKQFRQLKTITIKAAPENVNPKKYGLIKGIEAANHELLLLTDADCLPHSDHWICEMVAPFDSGIHIVLGFSQYKKDSGLLNAFIRFETLHTGMQYLSFALAGKPYMGVGRNLAYKKSFFQERKGFHKYLSVTGGDDDLFVNKNAHRKNTKISIGKKSLTVSLPKKSWRTYFRQKRRHLAAGKFYNQSDKLILGLLSLSHIIFWFTFVALAITGEEPYFVIGGFLMRMLVLVLAFYFTAKRLGDRINLLSLPILDFLFVCYYTATGISAIVSKDIKWS